MNTFTIEELDREEIEFLPPRVVLTVGNGRCNPCYVPCQPTIKVCVDLRVGCLLGASVNARV
jgi:hypothetical protein